MDKNYGSSHTPIVLKNMRKNENNFAFIDSNNLNLGIQKLGWKLDYRKFRIYLAEKYRVSKAYIFIGFVPLNQSLYNKLQEADFVVQLKPTVSDENGNIKGNVDADLVLRAALDIQQYDKAVIVSSDGDFYSLVQHLYGITKLAAVLSPDYEHCSRLLRRAAREKIYFMNNLRKKLEYKRKSAA
ncbi:MAG: NYN domain-containing protein [Parcubacteria group bacterium]|nr:NYN domain-containing protein [Parcubacteria group bacterium]